MILFTLTWYAVLYLKKRLYQHDALLENEEGQRTTSRSHSIEIDLNQDKNQQQNNRNNQRNNHH
jgi:hypothetical protein